MWVTGGQAATVAHASGNRRRKTQLFAPRLEQFDERYGVYRLPEAPAVIIGGGRVGRATARAREDRGLDYCIVEQNADLAAKSEKCVLGNAAELTVLQQAGIERAPAAIITTHDDDMNVYLTIYCRRLRPDIQIISRVALERNISTLHRAGADFVMSYASLGANAAMNYLEHGQTLMVAEGLDVFKIRVPRSLAGKAIAQLDPGERYHRAEVHLSEGGQDYDVMGWTRDQILADLVEQYEKHLRFLHLLR